MAAAVNSRWPPRFVRFCFCFCFVFLAGRKQRFNKRRFFKTLKGKSYFGNFRTSESNGTHFVLFWRFFCVTFTIKHTGTADVRSSDAIGQDFVKRPIRRKDFCRRGGFSVVRFVFKTWFFWQWKNIFNLLCPAFYLFLQNVWNSTQISTYFCNPWTTTAKNTINKNTINV